MIFSPSRESPSTFVLVPREPHKLGLCCHVIPITVNPTFRADLYSLFLNECFRIRSLPSAPDRLIKCRKLALSCAVDFYAPPLIGGGIKR